MINLMKKHSIAKGLEPGHIVFIGKKKIEKPEIRIIDYNDTELYEQQVNSIDDCFPFKDKPTITWTISTVYMMYPL